jgi:hypothetical protein
MRVLGLRAGRASIAFPCRPWWRARSGRWRLAQSRPIQVAMSASLPLASASVHQAGACWSVTSRPPATIAAAIRASACDVQPFTAPMVVAVVAVPEYRASRAAGRLPCCRIVAPLPSPCGGATTIRSGQLAAQNVHGVQPHRRDRVSPIRHSHIAIPAARAECFRLEPLLAVLSSHNARHDRTGGRAGARRADAGAVENGLARRLGRRLLLVTVGVGRVHASFGGANLRVRGRLVRRSGLAYIWHAGI